MPRPPFERLEPARREAIFDAAAAEFGEHGFQRASYNRIIERAGLSKGAMYYYFDDKQDLFVTVVDDAVSELFDSLEPLGEVTGAEAFWAGFERVSLAVWRRMLEAPRVARLMPALLDPRSISDVPEVGAVMSERATGWLTEVLRQGRAVHAVRDDLPDDLLLGVTLAVGMACDRWAAQRLMGEGGPRPEAPPPAVIVGTVVDLMRRLLAPA